MALRNHLWTRGDLGALTVPAGVALWAGAAHAQDPPAHFPKPPGYEQNYSYLPDTAQRRDLFDPVKYIPLGEGSNMYLSLGGEARERFETRSDPSFGFQAIDQEDVLLHRILLSADLHADDVVRTFIQFGGYGETGRGAGEAVAGDQSPGPTAGLACLRV